MNRQSERYGREGIDLSVSTLADQVGAATAALAPLHALIRHHVMRRQIARRRHHRSDPGQEQDRHRQDLDLCERRSALWRQRSSRTLYFASRDRRQEHPDAHLAGLRGILQADAYGGYNGLYNPRRKPGPVTSALCWSHARRGFFELADIAASARRGSGKAPISPIALEAVNRIDALFAIERDINA